MSALLIVLLALFLTTAIMGVTLSVTDALGRKKKNAIEFTPGLPKLTGPAHVQEARTQGRIDMFQAWLLFNIPTRWSKKNDGHTGHQEANRVINDPPKMGASLTELSLHGAELRRVKDAADSEKVFAAMRVLSARIYLLTDKEFQSATGATSDKYLASDDTEVVTAYLRGGADALSAIREDIIKARETERVYEQRRLGVEEISRTNDAALDALRETDRRSRTDAEKWTEKFEEGA